MTHSMLEPLNIGTFNARWFSPTEKRFQLQRLLSEEKLGITAVHDTKMNAEEQVSRALKPFLAHYEVCVSHAVSTAGAVSCF